MPHDGLYLTRKRVDVADRSADEPTLRRFLEWMAKQDGSPYSQTAYWVDFYLRGGEDMYGNRKEKT